MKTAAPFWIINALFVAVRFFCAWQIELLPSEARNFLYSQFINLSYLDSPPLSAYIIKISTLLLGNSEFAVRFPFIIAFLAAVYFFYLSVQILFGQKTAFWSSVLINMLPFSFFDGIFANGNSFFLCFSILSFFIFLLILNGKNKNLWYLLGVCWGLAALTKYSGFFIIISVFLFLIFSKENRHLLKNKEPYFAALIAAAFFSPVLIWNIENHLAAFVRILQIFSLSQISASSFFKPVIIQILYLTPLLFALFLLSAASALKTFYKSRDGISVIIFAFAVIPILFFSLLAVFSVKDAYSAAFGYFLLSAVCVKDGAAYFRQKKWFKFYSFLCGALCIVSIVLTVLFLNGKISVPQKLLSYCNFEGAYRGYEKLQPQIDKIAQRYILKNKPFILAADSAIADQMFFYMRKYAVFCINGGLGDYDFLQTNLTTLRGKTAIFISDREDFQPRKEYGAAFSSYSAPFEIAADMGADNKEKKVFYAAKCRVFEPSKLEQYNAKKEKIGEKENLPSALIKYDRNLFKFINRKLNYPLFNFITAPVSYLDSKGFNSTFFIILILSIAALFNVKGGKFWLYLALFASALIVSTLLNLTLKDYFDRARPISVFGQESVNFFYEILYSKSFPSGHTQAAFAMAVFTFMTSAKTRYKTTCILAAFLTAFERIYVGAHFPADVLVGAVLGSACAFSIVKLSEIAESRRKDKKSAEKKYSWRMRK
ncbi:MAG: glycosyltransferase family 39 protein [Elusimicrobiota bacterium]|jgi:4-amino-4-deoxy-L-arabinose transferase-like glycosyltransferase|nr:glycosyltransferase family 39 protein [Elusimicrobiota bacterium]